MKRLFMLLVLGVTMWAVSGCAGVASSGPKRTQRHRQITRLESRMFWDDFDYFWLMDKPSKLTKYHVRSMD